MEKEARNAIERATQRARKLLEEDFEAQLEGEFDVHRTGEVAEKAGAHLSLKQSYQRERIVAAIDHKRAAGMRSSDAVADYIRDAAFTTLNRFSALKMLEARDLLQECITKGEESAGYREFCGLAPGLALLNDSAGYRLYIESLFDELSTEVKVLFDRRDPSSALWPKRGTFDQLLEVINSPELRKVWGDDETIGWIYQFFNASDERKILREESQNPRTSRELAIRNQFFTPRYVVRFLTENTLGRIWYEMHDGQTAIERFCEYMLRKPDDTFIARRKKDPRDLRVLDPACGSGHFLLYAFDLLTEIYEEAWKDEAAPKSEATGRTLAEDYQTIDVLRRSVPGLIMAHNIYGVDIDSRCAKIAQLALWMRSQRAFLEIGLGRADRPQIRRGNIVVAETLAIDPIVEENFIASLDDAEIAGMFRDFVDGLKLAGDLGLLLRLEEILFSDSRQGKSRNIFAPSVERIRKALASFALESSLRNRFRNRLFIEDAEHGLDLLNITETKFDVVLMNPPFGSGTARAMERLSPADCGNLYSAFVRRAIELGADAVGCITDRTFLTQASFAHFRRDLLTGNVTLRALCDLGWGVLDANVQTAAYVLLRGSDEVACIDARELIDKSTVLRNHGSWKWSESSSFLRLPDNLLAYALPNIVLKRASEWQQLADIASLPRGLGSNKADRTYLAWVEVPEFESQEPRWEPLTNGGDFSPWWRENLGVADWRMPDGRPWVSMRSRDTGRPYDQSGSSDYFQPGLSFPKQSSSFNVAILPAGHIPTREGKAIIPREIKDTWYLLAYLNSGVVRAFVRDTCGLHKQSGAIGRIPIPPFSEEEKQELGRIGKVLAEYARSSFECDETSLSFRGPAALLGGISKNHTERFHTLLSQLDEIVAGKFGLQSSELTWIDAAVAPILYAPSERDLLSWAVGVVFGRFQNIRDCSQRIRGCEPDLLHEISRRSPAMKERAPTSDVILVSDRGHNDDLCDRVREVLRMVEVSFATNSDDEVNKAELDAYFQHQFFPAHLERYKIARRKAPIYWQLATATANYSVWLYIHAISKDTFYRIQNDYIGPKLAHEERRLELLAGELREGMTANQRKELNTQQGFVEDLRTFLAEIRLVAPLWYPNLDDGVIINFALLWRLVPQHKTWQKELKSTWEALCEGKYDWTHLAMHLWPERVVPKCATDRSLAVAHGLEEAFWSEDSDGKYIPRNTSTKSQDQIIREKTSPAVKAALKDLLDASAQGVAKKSTKRGKTNG